MSGGLNSSLPLLESASSLTDAVRFLDRSYDSNCAVIHSMLPTTKEALRSSIIDYCTHLSQLCDEAGVDLEAEFLRHLRERSLFDFELLRGGAQSTTLSYHIGSKIAAAASASAAAHLAEQHQDQHQQQQRDGGGPCPFTGFEDSTCDERIAGSSTSGSPQVAAPSPGGGAGGAHSEQRRSSIHVPREREQSLLDKHRQNIVDGSFALPVIEVRRPSGESTTSFSSMGHFVPEQHHQQQHQQTANGSSNNNASNNGGANDASYNSTIRTGSEPNAFRGSDSYITADGALNLFTSFALQSGGASGMVGAADGGTGISREGSTVGFLHPKTAGGGWNQQGGGSGSDYGAESGLETDANADSVLRAGGVSPNSSVFPSGVQGHHGRGQIHHHQQQQQQQQFHQEVQHHDDAVFTSAAIASTNTAPFSDSSRDASGRWQGPPSSVGREDSGLGPSASNRASAGVSPKNSNSPNSVQQQQEHPPPQQQQQQQQQQQDVSTNASQNSLPPMPPLSDSRRTSQSKDGTPGGGMTTAVSSIGNGENDTSRDDGPSDSYMGSGNSSTAAAAAAERMPPARNSKSYTGRASLPHRESNVTSSSSTLEGCDDGSLPGHSPRGSSSGRNQQHQHQNQDRHLVQGAAFAESALIPADAVPPAALRPRPSSNVLSEMTEQASRTSADGHDDLLVVPVHAQQQQPHQPRHEQHRDRVNSVTSDNSAGGGQMPRARRETVPPEMMDGGAALHEEHFSSSSDLGSGLLPVSAGGEMMSNKSPVMRSHDRSSTARPGQMKMQRDQQQQQLQQQQQQQKQQEENDDAAAAANNNNDDDDDLSDDVHDTTALPVALRPSGGSPTGLAPGGTVPSAAASNNSGTDGSGNTPSRQGSGSNSLSGSFSRRSRGASGASNATSNPLSVEVSSMQYDRAIRMLQQQQLQQQGGGPGQQPQRSPVSPVGSGSGRRGSSGKSPMLGSTGGSEAFVQSGTLVDMQSVDDFDDDDGEVKDFPSLSMSQMDYTRPSPRRRFRGLALLQMAKEARDQLRELL